MGAWIETSDEFGVLSKLHVAPYVGAWIETIGLGYNPSVDDGSHPMWVRGLKRCIGERQCTESMSHPMWVRGLKLTHKRAVKDSTGRTLCGCVD